MTQVKLKMSRTLEHMEGYRHAAKEAVDWLHARAKEMEDPKTTQVLNSAAWNLGNYFSRMKDSDNA